MSDGFTAENLPWDDPPKCDECGEKLATNGGCLQCVLTFEVVKTDGE